MSRKTRRLDDGSTSVQEMKEWVRKFCEEREWDQYHTAKDLAIGIMTEGAELLEHFIFQSDGEIERFFLNGHKRRQICEELSDTLYCILRFAQRYRIDLATELKSKIR